MSLEEQFEFAVNEISNLPPEGSGPSDSEKLEIYALYKQAKTGNCNTTRPGLLDFTGRAKWDAWNSKKGMSKQDAMLNYCNTFLDLSAKYNK